VRAFGHPNGTALVISASLAQIGEFSFILASLGVAVGLMPEEARDLILAGAILSILLNPLAFIIIGRLKPWLDRIDKRFHLDKPEMAAEPAPLPVTSLTG